MSISQPSQVGGVTSELVLPRRWLMIAMVFLATAINYLDRQALSVAAPVMIEQFHMSNIAYSRVLFGFLLSYTIMNAVSGPLIDRL
jgi:ACS family hexuronate transporter-like MFS transporter